MKRFPALAFEQHIAILGKTGSGKTYTAKGLVETLLDEDRQVCIIDPTSAWWGLRLKRDGKTKAYPVILIGGDRGDIPLSERSGAAVARLVTQQRASVVIDTGDMSVGEYTRWFTEFAVALYSTIRSPLHLIIDEAHQFMPQGKVPNPEAGKMLHAGNRLLSGGRSRGIRAMLITQRPAKLHKDSLTCAATLVAKQCIAPQDRQAVKDWIDGAADPSRSREIIDTLASLTKKEGWVWFPDGEFLDRLIFPEIKTYDSSKTPEHGAANAPKPGEIDLSEVRAAMAEAVAEAEANDPKLLRSQVADLKRQLAAKPNPAASTPAVAKPDPAAIERAVAKAVADRDGFWRRREKELTSAISRHAGTAEKARAMLATIVLNGEATPAEPPSVRINTRDAAPLTPAAGKALGTIARAVANSGDGTLTGLERALLTALANHPNGLTKGAACIYAGYRPSGDVSSAWSRFNDAGWIVRTADGVKITDAGLAAIGSFEQLPRGVDLQEHWIAKSIPVEAALLRVLFENPAGMPKGEIVEKAGYRPSGDVSSAWSKFNTLGWIQRTANGVKASDYWFD